VCRGKGEEEIYTIDDKDFEKRYAGKLLNKSGDGGVNIASVNNSVESKQKQGAAAAKPKAPA
jgi:hypothetical protein